MALLSDFIGLSSAGRVPSDVLANTSVAMNGIKMRKEIRELGLTVIIKLLRIFLVLADIADCFLDNVVKDFDFQFHSGYKMCCDFLCFFSVLIFH